MQNPMCARKLTQLITRHRPPPYLKHGGGSILLWGGISSARAERLIGVDGRMAVAGGKLHMHATVMNQLLPINSFYLSCAQNSSEIYCSSSYNMRKVKHFEEFDYFCLLRSIYNFTEQVLMCLSAHCCRLTNLPWI